MNLTENLASKIARLYRKRVHIVTKELKHLNINSNQSILLVNIGRTPGMNQNQLTELLSLDKTNMSKSLKTLDERGLIEKHLNPKDKRYYQIYLSKKGEKLLVEIRAVLSSIWEQNLQGISQEEKESFLVTLDKVLGNVENY